MQFAEASGMIDIEQIPRHLSRASALLRRSLLFTVAQFSVLPSGVHRLLSSRISSSVQYMENLMEVVDSNGLIAGQMTIAS